MKSCVCSSVCILWRRVVICKDCTVGPMQGHLIPGYHLMIIVDLNDRWFRAFKVHLKWRQV